MQGKQGLIGPACVAGRLDRCCACVVRRTRGWATGPYHACSRAGAGHACARSHATAAVFLWAELDRLKVEGFAKLLDRGSGCFPSWMKYVHSRSLISTSSWISSLTTVPDIMCPSTFKPVYPRSQVVQHLVLTDVENGTYVGSTCQAYFFFLQSPLSLLRSPSPARGGA